MTSNLLNTVPRKAKWSRFCRSLLVSIQTHYEWQKVTKTQHTQSIFAVYLDYEYTYTPARKYATPQNHELFK